MRLNGGSHNKPSADCAQDMCICATELKMCTYASRVRASLALDAGERTRRPCYTVFISFSQIPPVRYHLMYVHWTKFSMDMRIEKLNCHHARWNILQTRNIGSSLSLEHLQHRQYLNPLLHLRLKYFFSDHKFYQTVLNT